MEKKRKGRTEITKEIYDEFQVRIAKDGNKYKTMFYLDISDATYSNLLNGKYDSKFKKNDRDEVSYKNGVCVIKQGTNQVVLTKEEIVGIVAKFLNDAPEQIELRI